MSSNFDFATFQATYILLNFTTYKSLVELFIALHRELLQQNKIPTNRANTLRHRIGEGW